MIKKQHDECVAKEFDRAAERYDDSRLVKFYQRRTQALVVDDLLIQEGMRVLDLGCGTGTATLEIASRLEGTGKIVGLDLSEEMLKRAKKKLAERKYTNVEFLLKSASDLNYVEYFDHVFSTNAFHHFADKRDVFSRVYKSLRPGGIFLVQDICNDFVLMKALDLLGKLGEKAHVGSTTSKELIDLFFSTGFSGIKVKRTKLNWFWGIMIGTGIKQ